MKKKIPKNKQIKPKNKVEVKEEDYIVNSLDENHLIKKKSFLSKEYWKQNFIKKDFKRALIINMQYVNGSHKTFYVRTKNNAFKVDNNVYIVDENCLYYNISYKEFCLDYHERFSIPIKRNIPINEVNESIKANQNYKDIELSFDPSLIEKFTTSQIAEGIMRGRELSDFMRQLRLLVIISVLVGTISLLIMVNESGMLKSINIF